MHKLLFLILPLGAAAILTAAPDPFTPAKFLPEARVIKVIDGDTVDLESRHQLRIADQGALGCATAWD